MEFAIIEEREVLVQRAETTTVPEPGALYIAMSEAPPSQQRTFNSEVLQLNFFDYSGNEQTTFADAASICFSVIEEEERDHQCLGYLEESTGEWICEDPCLKLENGLLWYFISAKNGNFFIFLIFFF